MEVLLLVSNGTILGLLYQKLLEHGVILAELRARVSVMEGIIIERRKLIRPSRQEDNSGIE